MERNWIIFTPYGFIKNLRYIHPRDSHVEFMGKNKVGNTTWAQYFSAWLVKNEKTVFSKLTRTISLSVSGEQVSRQASARPAVFFLRILDTIRLVKYTVLFVLGKCLMDSEQVILIFTNVWPYNFHVSQ